jgi:hypothetical protein
MMKTRANLFLLGATVFLLTFQAGVHAQTSLLNVPSTDVVAPKKVYVEMDFLTNYAWERDAHFENYIPRTVIGVGGNVEVGANVSFTHVPGGGEPVELQPNAKWNFYRNENLGLAASVGCIGYVPLTNRAGTDTFGQCYSVASKQFSGRFGPRFTGGVYTLVAASADQGTKTGAIVAYEQPFSSRAGFIVDWFSGHNRFGYVSPGLYINLPHNSSLSGGYAIANHGKENNALFVYYGTQF